MSSFLTANELRMDSHSQNSAHLQIVQYLKPPGLEVKKLSTVSN